LGVDNCFATKRWPEPELWLGIVAHDLGLSLVQYSLDHVDPVLASEPGRSWFCAETARYARELQVEIFSTITGYAVYCFNLLSHPEAAFRGDGLRWCEEAILVTSKLGARGLTGHFDEFSVRDLQDPDRRVLLEDHLIDSLKYLARLACTQGQEFLILEQMYFPRAVPYTISQAIDFHERLNSGSPIPIHIGLDVGHACCHGYPTAAEDRDVYAWLRRMSARARVIHIHQTDAAASRHWPFTAEYNARGIIQPERVIDAIESSGADETVLMLELSHGYSVPETQVIDDLKRSVEYWQPYVS